MHDRQTDGHRDLEKDALAHFDEFGTATTCSPAVSCRPQLITCHTLLHYSAIHRQGMFCTPHL